MAESSKLDLTRRPRRNRSSSAVRALVEETRLQVEDLIQPLFIQEEGDSSEPVASMPGIFRYPLSQGVKACREIHELGIRAVALFPYVAPRFKNPEGSYAWNPDNFLFQAFVAIKKAVPELLVIADVALDPYTTHGHDGLYDKEAGEVLNDETVEILCKLAVMEAEAGADWVAPSDMMDGRVQAIRKALDQAGHTDVSIMAYSAKFASCYYGPFRDAVGSLQPVPVGGIDKRGYQLNPANTREALLETKLDEHEGADILLVKPAGHYLDIISKLRQSTLLPIAAYQVSGEYAQIHAASERGWLNLELARRESLVSIKRAGADVILTYFAKEMAKELRGKNETFPK